MIFGRDQSKLQSVVEAFSQKITAVQGDVTELSDLDKLYKTVNAIHGKIDVLIVNAGVAGGQIIDDVDERHFDEIMNINLKGAYFTVQKAVSFFKPNGSIVMISSMACHGGWIERIFSCKGSSKCTCEKFFSRFNKPRYSRQFNFARVY